MSSAPLDQPARGPDAQQRQLYQKPNMQEAPPNIEKSDSGERGPQPSKRQRDEGRIILLRGEPHFIGQDAVRPVQSNRNKDSANQQQQQYQPQQQQRPHDSEAEPSRKQRAREQQPEDRSAPKDLRRDAKQPSEQRHQPRSEPSAEAQPQQQQQREVQSKEQGPSQVEADPKTADSIAEVMDRLSARGAEEANTLSECLDRFRSPVEELSQGLVQWQLSDLPASGRLLTAFVAVGFFLMHVLRGFTFSKLSVLCLFLAVGFSLTILITGFILLLPDIFLGMYRFMRNGYYSLMAWLRPQLGQIRTNAARFWSDMRSGRIPELFSVEWQRVKQGMQRTLEGIRVKSQQATDRIGRRVKHTWGRANISSEQGLDDSAEPSQESSAPHPKKHQ